MQLRLFVKSFRDLPFRRTFCHPQRLARRLHRVVVIICGRRGFDDLTLVLRFLVPLRSSLSSTTAKDIILRRGVLVVVHPSKLCQRRSHFDLRGFRSSRVGVEFNVSINLVADPIRLARVSRAPRSRRRAVLHAQLLPSRDFSVVVHAQRAPTDAAVDDAVIVRARDGRIARARRRERQRAPRRQHHDRQHPTRARERAVTRAISRGVDLARGRGDLDVGHRRRTRAAPTASAGSYLIESQVGRGGLNPPQSARRERAHC